jgi:hypothetical protein
MHMVIGLLCALLIDLPPGVTLVRADEPTPAAAWELRVLGVNEPARLEQLRARPKLRSVRLAIVGQNGVSAKRLDPLLTSGNKLVYHDCADPDANTHDTQMARVILEITRPLGVTLELHVWQAGPSYRDYADKFRQAANVAHIVALYQSFWGKNAPAITQAIRESSTALFISPYVEHGGRPTSEAPQGSACKPWVADSIAHFVTVVPLARKQPQGGLLTPTDRGPTDSEAINFIAPSYHANGPGGTCPSAATAAACAAYLYAILPQVPSPTEAVDRLRAISCIDQAVLTSVAEFDAAAIGRLQKQIETLRQAAPDRQRKLDAPGVLNLYEAWRRLSSRGCGYESAFTLPLLDSWSLTRTAQANNERSRSRAVQRHSRHLAC